SRILIVGAGGVGSPIAASLAADGAGSIALYNRTAAKAEDLAGRLKKHYPDMEVKVAETNDPAGYDMVVNATSLGMKEGDPLPFDPERLSPETFVGEVVMKQEITPILKAARERGCPYQVGTDMLFEMIPAYLEFFGFGSATPEELRSVARLSY
ncbi:MAG: shikimate dehydrogenase, partial [Candidatus Accumulibacter sp.]|nr:shikimate dehydrogenase [Accumulibacter sp.]